SRNLGDVIHATPLGRYQEQRSVVYAPEHASETPAVKVDCLQRLTAFADAHASLVGNISVPDGIVGVEADTVGDAVAELGPPAPVRQAAVSTDVKGGKPLTVGLGDDQSCVVGRHGHAIRKGDAIGYLSSRAIGCNQRDDSGAAIDVGVAATVHDDFVPSLVREAAQVGMGH